METPLEQYTRLLSLYEHLERKRWILSGMNGVYNTAYHAEIAAEYKKLHPRRKYNFIKAKAAMPEVVDHIYDKWNERGYRITKALIEKLDVLKLKMEDLSEEITLEPADHFTKYATVHTSAYGSQTDAGGYTKKSCELLVAKAEMYGIEAHITSHLKTMVHEIPCRGGHQFGGVSTYGYFNVWVNLDPIGVRILKSKPGLTLRETVKWYLQHGRNPRVYMPMLPYDFEAKNGLDRFGNDIEQNMKVA